MLSKFLLLVTACAVAAVTDGFKVIKNEENLAGWEEFMSKFEDSSELYRNLAGQNPDFNDLNNALSGVIFGHNPGPCPSYAEACQGDIQNAPAWVKAIRIEFWLGQTRTIGEAVSRGYFRMWNFRCGNLAVENIVVTQKSLTSRARHGKSWSVLPIDIDVDDLRMDCYGNAEFDNMRIKIPLIWPLPDLAMTLSGTTDIQLSKSRMGGDGNGIVVNLGTEWFSDNFNTDAPEFMEFLSNSDGCYVGISNGVSLPNLRIDELGGMNLGGVMNLVIAIFKGLIECIICDLLTQVAYIKDTGAKGGLNLFIEEIRNDLQALVNEGLRSRPQFEADEVANPGRLHNIDMSKAIDFKTHTLFEAVSVGINDFVGKDSTEPGYTGRPVINEIVDVLNEDKTGVVEITDVKTFFELTEYPGIQFDTVLTNNKLDLVGFRFEGLNTFTKFNALNNGYGDRAGFGPAYSHSLLHDVEMDFFDFQVTCDLTMTPGEWVSPSGAQKTIQFRFGAGLRLNNLHIQAATYQLLQQDPIMKLQVGQLVGENMPGKEVANCAMKAVDHFRFSGLQASAGSVNNPRLVNFFNLASLVEDGLNMFNTMFKPTMAIKLPYIMENQVRKDLNDWLDNTYFTEAPPTCIDYVPLSYTGNDVWFNLKDSIAIEAVDNLLKNLIGGDPLTVNSVDVNHLIEGGMRYLVFDSEDAINNDPNSAYTFSNPAEGVWKVNEGIDLTVVAQSDHTKFVVEGPKVEHLDTITKFLLGPSSTDDFTLDFDFNWGNGNVNLQGGGTTYKDYVHLILPMQIDSLINGFRYAQEDFTLYLKLQLKFDGSIRLKVNKNELYQSVIEDLTSFSCMLAVVDEKTLEPLNIGLQDFEFGFQQVQPFTASDLGTALKAWDTYLRTDPGALQRTDHFLNYMILRMKNEAQKIFNKDFDPPYTRTECKTQVSPLNGTMFDTGVPLPDMGEINDALNKATQFQDNPRGNDPGLWENNVVGLGADVYDITSANNEYVSAISAAITPESARNALVSLANTTVNPLYPSILDPLYQMLVLEDDDTVTLRLDLNTLSNVNFEPDTEGLIPGLKVRFSEIVVTNIDQFTQLDIMDPYESDRGQEARFTTVNTINYGAKSMFLTFGAEIEVSEEIFVNTTTPEILRDTVNVTLNLTGVRLETLLSVAVNETDLGGVQLGEVIFFNETTHAFEIRPDAWNCTLKQIIYDNGLFFPQFQAYVDRVDGPAIVIDNTILNVHAADTLNALIRMFVDTFRKHIPNLTQGPLRDSINEILNDIIVEAKKTNTCKGVEYPDPAVSGKFFNFTRSELGDDLQFLISTDLLNPNSPVNINPIMERFVNDVKFAVPDLLNNTNIFYNGLDLGTATVNVGGFLFEKLGTSDGAQVVNMELLNNKHFGASKPYTTRTVIDMTGEFEFSFSLSYELDGLFADTGSDSRLLLGSEETPRMLSGSANSDVDLGATKVVHNDLRIGVRMKDMHFLLDLMTRIEITQVLDLYAGNLLNLYHKPSDVPCLLAIFDNEGLAPEDFEFSVSKLSLTVRCEGTCNSPMFKPLETTGGVTDDQVSGDLTSGFNGMIEAISALVGTTDAQQYINLAISTAREDCQGVDFAFDVPEDTVHTNAAAVMGWVGLGTVGGVLCAAIALVPLHVNRKQDLMGAAFGRLNKGDIKEKGEHLLLIEQRLKSCFQHPAVTNLARFGVPVTILIVIVLFIAANLFTVGVTVQIKIFFAGDVTVPLPLMEFTLESSINDMWNSGTEALGLIIFIASGFWPHTKSLLLLFCWFAPPTVIGQKKRGGLLGVLDQLGKWSLIDAYVLIMLQVAFRFYLSTSFVTQLSWLPADLGVVDVAVIPGASIYLFLIATMAALIVNHVMIAQHHKIMRVDEELEDSVNNFVTPTRPNTKKPLHQHVFLVPDERNILYGFGPGVKLCVGALLSISVLMTMVGSFLPFLTFEFKGVAGILIGFIDSSLQINTKSSVGIATSVTDGIPSDDIAARIGVLFLQIVYLTFTLLTPIVLIICHAVLWLVPLTLRDQKKLYFFTEICSAWVALEVLVVSAVAATLQISQLAIFIVGSATGSACDLLVEPLKFLGVPEEDALCFDVYSYIEGTGIILIVGSVFTILANILMFRLNGASLRDREAQFKGKLDTLSCCPKTHGNIILKNCVRPVSRIRAGDPNQLTSSVAPTSFGGPGDYEDTGDVSSGNPMFSNIDV